MYSRIDATPEGLLSLFYNRQMDRGRVKIFMQFHRVHFLQYRFALLLQKVGIASGPMKKGQQAQQQRGRGSPHSCLARCKIYRRKRLAPLSGPRQARPNLLPLLLQPEKPRDRSYSSLKTGHLCPSFKKVLLCRKQFEELDCSWARGPLLKCNPMHWPQAGWQLPVCREPVAE